MCESPNTTTFGTPISKGDGKLSDEIYDAEHGKYQGVQVPTPAPRPPTNLDPKPF